MKKKGELSFIGLIIIILILITLFSTGMLLWKSSKEIDQQKQDAEANNTGNNSIVAPINNQSTPTTNQSNIQTNQSTQNTTNTTTNESTDVIPNPTGIVQRMDRENSGADYHCNNSVDAKHSIRLYTYKIINGVKNLSEEYIEDNSPEKICKYYENASAGINYEVEWQWTTVQGIDGYRLFQYYSYEDIQRDYNHSVDLKANTWRFLDTSKELWKEVS